MISRVVPAMHGWRWVVEGARLFARNPMGWFAIVGTLFIVFKVMILIPYVGFVAILLLPVFVAGLMQAARGLEAGQELKVTYLLSGFQRNAGALITLGGISLVGNLLTLLVIQKIGGEAMDTIMKLGPKVASDKSLAEPVRAAMAATLRAMAIGMAISLPLTMALWFSPMLAYFDGRKPLAAMLASVVACAKNAGPLLVYALVVFAALIVVTPVSLATRILDLGLWLLAPILTPSLYASFKDVFVPGEAPAPPTTAGA